MARVMMSVVMMIMMLGIHAFCHSESSHYQQEYGG